MYKNNILIKDICIIFNCNKSTVSNIIKSNNIERNKVFSGNCNKPKKVKMFSLENKFIYEFNSLQEASIYLKNKNIIKIINGGVRQKISLCARNKLKTAYKYI